VAFLLRGIGVTNCDKELFTVTDLMVVCFADLQVYIHELLRLNLLLFFFDLIL